MYASYLMLLALSAASYSGHRALIRASSPAKFRSMDALIFGNHHDDGKFIAARRTSEQPAHRSVRRVTFRRGIHRVLGLDSLIVFGYLLGQRIVGPEHVP